MNVLQLKETMLMNKGEILVIIFKKIEIFFSSYFGGKYF